MNTESGGRDEYVKVHRVRGRVHLHRRAAGILPSEQPHAAQAVPALREGPARRAATPQRGTTARLVTSWPRPTSFAARRRYKALAVGCRARSAAGPSDRPDVTNVIAGRAAESRAADSASSESSYRPVPAARRNASSSSTGAGSSARCARGRGGRDLVVVWHGAIVHVSGVKGGLLRDALAGPHGKSDGHSLCGRLRGSESAAVSPRVTTARPVRTFRSAGSCDTWPRCRPALPKCRSGRAPDTTPSSATVPTPRAGPLA